MKKTITVITAGLIASATLMLAGPAAAASIDVHVGIPVPVYVAPRPVYIQPQYENDWRERRVRASEWRAHPRNHGQAVSAAAHERNDHRKSHKKHGRDDGKHGHGH